MNTHHFPWFRVTHFQWGEGDGFGRSGNMGGDLQQNGLKKNPQIQNPNPIPILSLYHALLCFEEEGENGRGFSK
jgi:hypothetical protein